MRDFFTMWRDEFPIVMVYMYIIQGMYMTEVYDKGFDELCQALYYFSNSKACL